MFVPKKQLPRVRMMSTAIAVGNPGTAPIGEMSISGGMIRKGP